MPSTEAPLLDVRHLRKFYPLRAGFLQQPKAFIRAVDDVSFTVAKGRTLSLVGESGCGKTTTSRAIVRALAPTAGEVLFQSRDGTVIDVAKLPRSELRPPSPGQLFGYMLDTLFMDQIYANIEHMQRLN